MARYRYFEGTVIEPLRLVQNPSTPGERTFSRFHHRKPDKGVFPFHRNEGGSIELPDEIQFPDKVKPIGHAVRTLYESDKWNPTGKTTEYFHDHGENVTFYEPSKSGERFYMPWPEEIVLLGKCIGFVMQPFEDTGTENIVEGIMKGKNILVSSPDGWVDKAKTNRVFLAIVNLDGGGIEAIIDGGNLRITSHGIEG